MKSHSRGRRPKGVRRGSSGCHGHEYPSSRAAWSAATGDQEPYQCFDHDYEVWHLPRKGY